MHRDQVGMETFSVVDVYESATQFVLVGHDGPRRRLLYVCRQALPADMLHNTLPPVNEDPRSDYSEASCAEQLVAVGKAGSTPLFCVVRHAPAFLGMVRFLEGWYMLFVTHAEVAGTIGGHPIHRVEETAMLSLNHPTSRSGGSSVNFAPRSTAGTNVSFASGHASVAAAAGGVAAGSTPSHSSHSFFQGGKSSSWNILHAAMSGLAIRLRLPRWTENWAETKCGDSSYLRIRSRFHSFPLCSFASPS